MTTNHAHNAESGPLGKAAYVLALTLCRDLSNGHDEHPCEGCFSDAYAQAVALFSALAGEWEAIENHLDDALLLRWPDSFWRAAMIRDVCTELAILTTPTSPGQEPS